MQTQRLYSGERREREERKKKLEAPSYLGQKVLQKQKSKES